MKLNLGCGQNHMPGYVNVDKEQAANPDRQVDLETFPWPFDDNSAEEIVMSHVLEHLGQDPQVFLGIIKELYRISTPNAQITIVVPHPRHDHYLSDPTHVRPVLPEMMHLFSKSLNRECKEKGISNSPLGLYLDVDFHLVNVNFYVDDRIQKEMSEGKLSQDDVSKLMITQNNIVQSITMTLRAIKA